MNRDEPKTVVEVSLLSRTKAADEELVKAIAALVNSVYAVAEAGLWLHNAVRTNDQEVAKLIAAGEIATARCGQRLSGVVRVHRLDDRTGEFGMLAVDSAYRNRGLGRVLMEFAERHSREQGLELMQLELLVPRAFKHPSKEFLKTWYERCGYGLAGERSSELAYPQLAPFLSTPCDFMIYQKVLGS